MVVYQFEIFVLPLYDLLHELLEAVDCGLYEPPLLHQLLKDVAPVLFGDIARQLGQLNPHWQALLGREAQRYANYKILLLTQPLLLIFVDPQCFEDVVDAEGPRVPN